MRPFEVRPDDLAHCDSLLRAGSKSFSVASRLLPAPIRERTTVLYAFCRVTDDHVDDDPLASKRTVDGLRRRLDEAFAGRSSDDPVDRAFAALLQDTPIPPALPEALLEGMEWDVEGRRYANLEELQDYAARVAGTVGAMMTLLMGVREPKALARACDLGIAMQLTNVARDVGEDARRGRVYLPFDWLEGIDVEAWLARPAPIPEVKTAVRRLLDEADALYRRADRGVAMLPRECRIAIRAARLVYSDIGRTISAADYDSVTRRAVVPRSRKLWLLLRASSPVSRAARPIDQPPLRAAEALVAAAREGEREGERETEGRYPCSAKRGTSAASPDELAAVTRGLRHIYHGDTVDRVCRYAVQEGALPPDLTGRVLFTVLAYEAVFNDGTLASNPHMLSAPGRLLSIDLDPALDGTLRLQTNFLQVQSWHIRQLAPRAVVRTDFAEVSWLGIMNLANTMPLPVFPQPHPDGRTGRRMLMTYDAGRPSEIDPRSLAHVTPVGNISQYMPAVKSSFSPMIMTTGHPVYDPEPSTDCPQGRLVYAHLVPRALDLVDPSQRCIRADLYVMSWDGTSRPSRPLRVCVDGEPVLLDQASAHQICLTRDHVVIFNATLVLNGSALAEPLLALLHESVREAGPTAIRPVLDRVWRSVSQWMHAPVPSPRCPVFVIAKRELEEALRAGRDRVDSRRFILPSELTHAVADHDDAEGRITIFAQHNIGADPADQVEEGDRLVDGRVAQREFLGLFTGSTDLNQVRKHVLDVRTGGVTTTAFPDPEDPATFRFGLNLLPPVAPVAFEPASAPGRVGDLTRAIERLETTYWISGGWIPDTASERAFDNFRGANHPRLVPEAEYRARVADPSNTVQLFALDHDLRLDSSYAFPHGWFMGTPVWIPKPGARSTREGWLVGPVWGPDEAHAEIWVFDTAVPLSTGPACKLGPAPGEQGVRPGFPLHGSWLDREGVEAWQRPTYQTEMLDVPTYVKLAEAAVMSSSLITRAAKQLFGR